MIFEDRRHAGEILAAKLSRLKLKSTDSVIVGIPRGGVVVAHQVSSILKIPLKVIVIKKLGAPNNAELAIGATASFGKPVLDRWLVADLKVTPDYIKKEVNNKKREAKAREKFLGVKNSPEDFKDREAVVVDDGLATGQTVKMAARVLRQFGASKLILAVPCAAPSTLEAVRQDYDNVVCPEISADFWAVGQFYRDFAAIGDSEVKQMLRALDKEPIVGVESATI